MIRAISLLFFLYHFSLYLAAQSINVSGRVTDEQGRPLAFATAALAGTPRGVGADSLGRFALTAPAGQRLVVSFLGYESATIRLGGRDTTLSIILQPTAATVLDLVTITAVRPVIPGAGVSIAPMLRLNPATLLPGSGFNINEAIDGLPGVHVQQGALNTNRLSIRGVGARTPFATDEVRIYWNDIPLTNGVGESALEDLEPDLSNQLDIWRGPSPARFGAGLGGAIALRPTPTGEGMVSPRLRFTAGSFGRRQLVTEVGLRPTPGWQTRLIYANTHSDGYRDNNRYDRESATLSGQIGADNAESSGSRTVYLLHYRHLRAEIPSSLNRTDFEQRPRIAPPNWAGVRGREDQRNALVGLHHEQRLAGNGETGQLALHATVFGGWRTNDEVRPFNVLVEDGRSGGLRAALHYKRPSGATLQLGGELFVENYDQRLFETLEGGEQGGPLAHYDERRRYQFVYLSGRQALGRHWLVEAALTWRGYSFRWRDVDGAEALEQPTQSRLLPRLELAYLLGERHEIFALAATGLSVPSVEETLPGLTAGRSDLDAEQGANLEMGLRGQLPWLSGLRYELTAFHLLIRDALTARQDTADLTYFINGGRNRHQGVEVYSDWQLLQRRRFGLRHSLAYTFGDYRFADFRTDQADFSGNQLPGVPRHRLRTSLEADVGGFFTRLTIDHGSRQAADDANTAFADAYTLLHWKSGWRHGFTWLNLPWTIDLYAGIDNLLDEHYAAMLQVNAAAFGTALPRYYYPGLPRNVYGGVAIRMVISGQ